MGIVVFRSRKQAIDKSELIFCAQHDLSRPLPFRKVIAIEDHNNDQKSLTIARMEKQRICVVNDELGDIVCCHEIDDAESSEEEDQGRQGGARFLQRRVSTNWALEGFSFSAREARTVRGSHFSPPEYNLFSVGAHFCCLHPRTLPALFSLSLALFHFHSIVSSNHCLSIQSGFRSTPLSLFVCVLSHLLFGCCVAYLSSVAAAAAHHIHTYPSPLTPLVVSQLSLIQPLPLSLSHASSFRLVIPFDLSLTQQSTTMTTIKRNCANSLHVAHMDSLPQDILIEILKRVPLEFILSCKLVSKKWKTIISDPMFYKTHSNQTCTAFFLGLQRLYCLFTRHSNPEPAIPTTGPPFVVREIPIGTWDKRLRCHYHYNIILLNSGWSNGWIGCFNECGALFLFHNPFTGASFKVKNAPMRGHAITWLCYGFGYDPLGDDYVIFVVCSNYHSLSQGSRRKRMLGKNRFQSEDNSWFWVYSFGSKRWKRSSGFPYSSEEAYEWLTPNERRAPLAQCINGVLHWLVFNKETQMDMIVTYNLHSGTFGEFSSVPLDVVKDPPCLPPDGLHPHMSHVVSFGKLRYTRSLAHFNGQLCYIAKTDCKEDGSCSYSFKYEMWVMKEYGSGDSWEKLASIDCSKVPDPSPHCLLSRSYGSIEGLRWDSVTPAMLYQGGDGKKLVLFVCNYYQKLFWYDLMEEKVESIDRMSWQKTEWMDLIFEYSISARGYF